MCMYCGDGIVAAHIISEEQSEDFTPGVAAYVMNGMLTVSVDGDS